MDFKCKRSQNITWSYFHKGKWLHFFLIKRKNRDLNTKSLHKNFLGIILLSTNLWETYCGKGRIRVGLVRLE
jgi:hypothetical protein